MKKGIVMVVVSGLFLMTAFLTGAVFSRESSPVKIAWTTRVTRYIQHTVSRGDTVEKLAMIYGTTIPKILAKNSISNKNQALTEGQKLIIPVHGYSERVVL